jgi:hypothetical protein
VICPPRSKAIPEDKIWVGTTQGNCTYEVDDAMPPEDFRDLDMAKKRADSLVDAKPAIVVCHSLPFFWARPFNSEVTCAPCPPWGYTPAVAIGRAMAETDM